MKTMRKELGLVTERGYAVDYGETRDTICGLAAPVLNDRGNVVAAFTVAGRTTVITVTTSRVGNVPDRKDPLHFPPASGYGHRA